MRRRVPVRLAIGFVVVLAVAVLAGCTSPISPPQVPAEDLNESQAYDWDTETAAEIRITTDHRYHAVYAVNDTEFAIYQRTRVGSELHVRVRSVFYRPPNGSARPVGPDNVTVEERRTVVDLPAAEGQVAFTGTTLPKRFQTPRLVNGSHAVYLPPDRRVSLPIAGEAHPDPDRREWRGDRRYLRWDELDEDGIRLQYYLQRDIYLFLSVLAGAGLAAVIGALYVRGELRRLRREREELGIEIDPAEDDRDPPP